MSVSLLFPEGKSKATDTSFAERLSADLMLDESFSYITADITKRRYFLSVLADVQPDPDIPLYRAEILRDFCSKSFCHFCASCAFTKPQRHMSKRCAKKRLPLCYPELTSDGPARYEELYDLFLCASYIDAGSVVPNDADLSHGGILVTGANNTGKTVFLRSVGTAQLLAQAGLPIIAKSATVRMRCDVYSLYAAAEKEFAPGVDAGRFEQEVRLVAEMLKSIKPGALVLINELFQTTSYPEGAEGLCGILRYLRSDVVGADFIAVTHLTDLIDMMAGETVHMRTLEGENLYKLEKVTRSYWRGIGC